MMDHKLKEALLEAAANHAEGGPADPEARKLIESFTTVRWSKTPEGSKCPGCGQETLERSHHLMGGPWSGSVRCTECGHKESVASYVGKTMIAVQPLTPEEVAEYEKGKP